MDQWRVTTFLRELADRGELVEVGEPTPLGSVASRLESERHAVWFHDVQASALSLAGGLLGSRARVGIALGVPAKDVTRELRRRATALIPPTAADGHAPVHDVVLTGDDIDVTALPIHLQHERDGSTYVSGAIDITLDHPSSRVNVGCRRFMVRGRRELGIDVSAPSDLRAVVRHAARQGASTVPIAIVVGVHPADWIAAALGGPIRDDEKIDELSLLGAVRQASVPTVDGATVPLPVPADAECVIEGLIEVGRSSEQEGPYGEYLGYYGGVKRNPVVHVTAITHRSDAVFVTGTIGGPRPWTTDTANLCALATEQRVWTALAGTVRSVHDVYAPPAAGGLLHARAAIDYAGAGGAKNALLAMLASPANLKQAAVVDADVDIHSDAHVEWAMATRFQASRDLVVIAGMRTVALDPSQVEETSTKVGLDLTAARRSGAAAAVAPPRTLPEEREPDGAHPESGRTAAGAGSATLAAAVEEELSRAPATFQGLMVTCGIDDPRALVRALEPLWASNRLEVDGDGSYRLAIHR